jgi:ubiquinone/menaquinone biosynthesis C-methylase UbiE
VPDGAIFLVIPQVKTGDAMSSTETQQHYSAAGQRLANASFVDAHYAVCRTMYESMMRAVGIQKGWHVLDAGCGSGSFLPLLSELVGPAGKITAVDLDATNIERANLIASGLTTRIETHIGNLTELPFADHTFDAIWNANVSQYLDDTQFRQMLHEFVRVTKPSGLVAIKESDPTMLQLYPLDIAVFWRYNEQIFARQPGFLRIPAFVHWLSAAGLHSVKQQIFLEEQHAPFSPAAQAFLFDVVHFFAQEAERFGVSEADLVHWRNCHDPGDPNNPMNHREAYFREGCTLAIGSKPTKTR